MQASRTSLRLPENSELHFDVLKAREAGEEIISDTRLRLVSGAIIGSQRKLSRPSLFEISTPDGKATITGTEYVVRADGAVSVLSGAVTVMYKEQGQGRPVRVTVQPGQSFDPATGQVVETTPDYLTDLIAEIDTVKNNAEHFNLDGAKVTVKAERLISPTVGNN